MIRHILSSVRTIFILSYQFSYQFSRAKTILNKTEVKIRREKLKRNIFKNNPVKPHRISPDTYPMRLWVELAKIR